MANEFSPELDQSVLDAIKRKIQEQQAQQISDAEGSAIARGLTGSTYEATRIGLANQGAINAQTDAMVNLALQRATQQREERLTQEQRTYESGESQKGRDFQSGESQKGRDFQTTQTHLSEQYNSLENEKQRAYASGETDKARGFEQQQAELQRQFTQGQDERNSRSEMINSGISGGLGLVGNLIGKGGGGAASTTGGALGSPLSLFGSGPGSTLGSAGATATGGGLGTLGTLGLGGLGYAANVGISSGIGQLAGKALFKSDQARTAARKGAQIGSLILPGVGGVAGAAIGGSAQSVGKAVKKLFCFDGDTLIPDVDGDLILISEITLGTELLDGGIVESVRKSLTADGTRFKYKDVGVTGSHAVNEDGTWIRIKDSPIAVPVEGHGVVYSLVTSTHRIFINGIEFADEYENDGYEELSIDESLDCLNQMVAA